ncbi:hypothetical protein GOODEAATRI_025120 [Goodea atripinnis]|uniref:Uncharacterized protein n=1 Tax=Goodea atripinnis TaxID=208336 RepID=A0ABV0PS69_9TELE
MTVDHRVLIDRKLVSYTQEAANGQETYQLLMESQDGDHQTLDSWEQVGAPSSKQQEICGNTKGRVLVGKCPLDLLPVSLIVLKSCLVNHPSPGSSCLSPTCNISSDCTGLSTAYFLRLHTAGLVAPQDRSSPPACHAPRQARITTGKTGRRQNQYATPLPNGTLYGSNLQSSQTDIEHYSQARAEVHPGHLHWAVCPPPGYAACGSHSLLIPEHICLQPPIKSPFLLPQLLLSAVN